MNRPGSVSKMSTPTRAQIAAMKSGRAAMPYGPPQLRRRHVVQPHDRLVVDELDDGGDHDRGQRGLGQGLEEAREEEQREHGQHGDEETRDL